MKKLTYIIIYFAMSCAAVPCFAQDAIAKFDEAEKSYSAKDLENSRYALQLALVEINKAIGKEILTILPTKLSDMPYNATEDNVTGAAGFAGLFVNRAYGDANTNKNGKIEIMSDSPMITALNGILAMPAMFAGSDPNEKRLKIGGYKSLLKKSTDDANVVTYTLQVPMNQTLLTITVNGINSENEVIAFANSLPIDKIAKASE
jgi:hypothetical protein